MTEDNINRAIQELKERFTKKINTIHPERLQAQLPRGTDLHQLYQRLFQTEIRTEITENTIAQTLFDNNIVHIRVHPELTKQSLYPILLKYLAHEFGHHAAPHNAQHEPKKNESILMQPVQRLANTLYSYHEVNRKKPYLPLALIKQTANIMSSFGYKNQQFFADLEQKLTEPLTKRLRGAQSRETEFFCDRLADWLVPEFSLRMFPSKNPLPLPHTNPIFRACNATYELMTGSDKAHPTSERRMYASEQKLANNSGNILHIMGKWLSGHARE